MIYSNFLTTVFRQPRASLCNPINFAKNTVNTTDFILYSFHLYTLLHKQLVDLFPELKQISENSTDYILKVRKILVDVKGVQEYLYEVPNLVVMVHSLALPYHYINILFAIFSCVEISVTLVYP